MSRMLAHRTEAQKTFLDLFATVTELPIGLYEIRDGSVEGVFSERSLANFESHCRLIQSFPGGKALCEADQCNRARIALRSHDEELTLCHAGLYNQAVPVKVDGDVRAVLLYGEMQIEGVEYQQMALTKHRQAVARLNLTEEQAAQLQRLLLAAKKYKPQQLRTLKNLLPKVEGWFYVLIDEEDRLKRSVEKITHEIQTRLQAVIANAENLVMEIRTLSPEEAHEQASHVLYSALALDTVVQNLGEYLEEYRFRKHPIAPLLYEAKRLYEGEATRRGIDIYVRLNRVDGQLPSLEISRHHMQYALNNLIHNAVKYSFRSGPGRHRYVLITGQPDRDCYKLTIQNYGVGILPEEIESGAIFQDGYQGKLTQGEYRTGSGKGLAFVQRVIDHHRGSIEVESKLMADQEGPEGKPHLTRFTVKLPYERPKES